MCAANERLVLQLAESVSQMTDLIRFSAQNKMGPVGAYCAVIGIPARLTWRFDQMRSPLSRSKSDKNEVETLEGWRAFILLASQGLRLTPTGSTA